MQGHNGQLTSSTHSKKVGEVVLPNIFLQNKLARKIKFPYEPELFSHESRAEPCMPNPDIRLNSVLAS